MLNNNNIKSSKIHFGGQSSWQNHTHTFSPYTLPILDTLQKMTNSLLVNVDITIDTKRLARIKVPI